MLVSHGAIEILGTPFTVVQEDERGSVTLHEGEILFHDAGGGTRERFSYELGSILTYQLGDRASACRHWQEHARRYPDGRYQTEVLQAAAHARWGGSAR